METLLIAFAGFAALAAVYGRDHRSVKRERRAFFDRCRGLFDTAEIVQDGVNYPVLTGRYRGHAVRLEPIVESVAVRKLPSLWLLATVLEETPVRARFDLMMRVLNVEFYSPFDSLPHSLERPLHWPEHASLRTDAPHRLPPLSLLDRHVAYFEHPKAKELLITPRGVRFVYQVDEGERSQYLLLRSAMFKTKQLSPEVAADLLDRAIAVRADLIAHANACKGTQDDAAAVGGARSAAR